MELAGSLDWYTKFNNLKKIRWSTDVCMSEKKIRPIINIHINIIKSAVLNCQCWSYRCFPSRWFRLIILRSPASVLIYVRPQILATCIINFEICERTRKKSQTSSCKLGYLSLFLAEKKKVPSVRLRNTHGANFAPSVCNFRGLLLSTRNRQWWRKKTFTEMKLPCESEKSIRVISSRIYSTLRAIYCKYVRKKHVRRA